MGETASATMSYVQLDPSTYQYSINLNNIGTTSIGTLWFAWLDSPNENFLPTEPTSPHSPTSWNGFLTHQTAFADGYGILWEASNSASYLAPGNSLSGFSFTSTDAPSIVFGPSAIHPGFQVTYSIVYATSPFADAGYDFVVAQAPSCFLAGTHIRGIAGVAAVETLRVGDMLVTAEGACRPVNWIGHRRIDTRYHPAPEQLLPVRIARDAFGRGKPRRTLHLSPDHAVFVDGVLIPVKYLLNGASIATVRMDTIEYYHVKLDRHDVLLAEDLPVESYLDFGDCRAMASRIWETAACAPLIVTGPALDAVRLRIARRHQHADSAAPCRPVSHARQPSYPATPL